MRARAALVALALAGCNLPPPDAPDARPACARACARREELACIEPRFVPTCVATCERAASAGLFNPACAAAATTRGEMQACRVRCLP